MNLLNRNITVRHSKSGKQREVPVDDVLQLTLSVLPSQFGKELVFPSPVTGRRRYDVKRAFNKAIREAKIEDFRFHDLRHTAASYMVMNGLDVKSVHEILGHASLAMTQKYAHLAPDYRMRAIRILNIAYQTDTETAREDMDNADTK